MTWPHSAAQPVRIMHEVKGRIRLRCLVLASPLFDGLYFQAGLENISGVHAVRINTRAACAVIHHDGAELTRQRILAFAASAQVQAAGENRVAGRGLYSIFSLGLCGTMALATLFAPKVLAAPIAFALSLPVMAEGVMVLVRSGLKVEVLDAGRLWPSALPGAIISLQQVSVFCSLPGNILRVSARIALPVS